MACMSGGSRRILNGKPAESRRSCGLQVSSTLNVLLPTGHAHPEILWVLGIPACAFLSAR